LKYQCIPELVSKARDNGYVNNPLRLRVSWERGDLKTKHLINLSSNIFFLEYMKRKRFLSNI
jgi:hypothetical protein